VAQGFSPAFAEATAMLAALMPHFPVLAGKMSAD
jgi:hypothetical protein